YSLNLLDKWRAEVYDASVANVTITGWTTIKIDPLLVTDTSELVSIKVIEDLIAPDAVTGLEPVHGNESVALSWNASTEADLKHYCVYYKNATFTNVTEEAEVTLFETTTNTTSTVTGLTNGITYYFAVTAVDVVLNENKTVTPVSATPNAAPIASALAITPAEPKTTDDLVASYTYYDYDADAESGTEIRWYKYEDDVPVLQEAYNDTTVPSAATAKGQVWYFTVKPKDGIDFGDLVTSATVTILDSAPTLTNPTIEPAEGDVDTEFTFSVTYTDADGDAPTSVRVVIDGINYNMSKVSGEYATGAEYEYKTKLTAGTHTYKFNVDVAGVTVTETASAEITVKEKPIEWLYIVAIIIIIIIIIAIAVAVAKKKKKPEVPPEEKPGE
ncbi:MAG: fibronectin type III domain-containing protein, partial [Candidatus Thermoplasmatota archaeon]|nr:fibronectin type III domain-containing protein [Candidatus Thermoplasmatota archaeon]